MFLAFVLLLALRGFYKGQRCFKVPLIVPRVAGPNMDETQADWVRGSERFGRLGTLMKVLALVLCTFVYSILSHLYRVH